MPSPNSSDPALEYLGELDETECVLVAQQYLAAGSLREALAVCVSRGPHSGRGLRLCEARARLALGERDRALAIITELATTHPRDVVCAFYKSQIQLQAGQAQAAHATLCELIATAPDFPGALPALAQLTFPGPPYREVLRRLHARLRPEVYLEIGVEHGTSLQLATHSRVVIGVDPTPKQMPRELSPQTRLFQMTSDDFFARHSQSAVLGEAHVDLAFVDGMHLFEFALRDFHNVERWCAPGSLLVLHDCLPAHGVAALRERRTSFWVGDTWKALEYLIEQRPDLRVAVIPCYPSGLVVVQTPRAEAESARPAALEAFCTGYAATPYPYAPGRWPQHYPLIPNSERGLSELLDTISSATAKGRGK